MGQAPSRELAPTPLPVKTCEPVVSSCPLPRIPARPNSAGGVRRTTARRNTHPETHDTAITMAPMLRARHMALLDLQYLNECTSETDAKTAFGKPTSCARPSRSTSSHGRAQSARDHVASKGAAGGPTSGNQRRTQSSRGCLASKSAACESAHGSQNAAHQRKSIGCQNAVQRRPLGPKTVMPLVKGQMKVQAECVRREADKVARNGQEARLKEQHRSQPSSYVRGKSKGRSNKLTPISSKWAGV